MTARIGKFRVFDGPDSRNLEFNRRTQVNTVETYRKGDNKPVLPFKEQMKVSNIIAP